MKREYCLDIDGNVYTIGDLNMFLDNKEPISYPAADSQNPTRPFFTGTIRQEVEVNGVKRSFLLYIPQHYPFRGAGFSSIRMTTYPPKIIWKIAAGSRLPSRPMPH